MNFDHIDIIQSLIDGVLFGSIYALIGLGFTLIFGAMHKLNLAYAASSIAGAYSGLMSLTIFGLPPLMAFIIGPIMSGVIGLILYFACFRFMPRGNQLAPLMASIGALFFIDELIIHETSGSPMSFPAILPDAYFFLGEFGIRGDLLLVMGFSLSLIHI